MAIPLLLPFDGDMIAAAHPELCEDLTLLLAEGAGRHARAVVRRALESGVPGAELSSEVIAPAMVAVGELAARGLVTVGQEHRAALLCGELLDIVAPARRP